MDFPNQASLSTAIQTAIMSIGFMVSGLHHVQYMVKTIKFDLLSTQINRKCLVVNCEIHF